MESQYGLIPRVDCIPQHPLSDMAHTMDRPRYQINTTPVPRHTRRSSSICPQRKAPIARKSQIPQISSSTPAICVHAEAIFHANIVLSAHPTQLSLLHNQLPSRPSATEKWSSHQATIIPSSRQTWATELPSHAPSPVSVVTKHSTDRTWHIRQHHLSTRREKSRNSIHGIFIPISSRFGHRILS